MHAYSMNEIRMDCIHIIRWFIHLNSPTSLFFVAIVISHISNTDLHKTFAIFYKSIKKKTFVNEWHFHYPMLYD